jgi:hypothetical protein
MLSDRNKPTMLSFVMLNVTVLSVVMLSVIALRPEPIIWILILPQILDKPDTEKNLQVAKTPFNVVKQFSSSLALPENKIDRFSR